MKIVPNLPIFFSSLNEGVFNNGGLNFISINFISSTFTTITGQDRVADTWAMSRYVTLTLIH